MTEATKRQDSVGTMWTGKPESHQTLGEQQVMMGFHVASYFYYPKEAINPDILIV